MARQTNEQIKNLKAKYKGKGQIMSHSLTYLNDKHFFVNKQFDNKSFSIFGISESRLSEGLLGLFKTKKAAIEFGKEIGLEQVEAPKYENI